VSLAARTRAEPLRPAGAVAEGDAARRLARRLLALDDAALARLAGVAAPGLLAVAGVEEDLPWVDGVAYVGRDPAAPSLLLPTATESFAPAALLERALVAGSRGAPPPLAVLEAPLRVIPLGGARPVERVRLAAWLAREEGA
jgi:hypothetical protein